MENERREIIELNDKRQPDNPSEWNMISIEGIMVDIPKINEMTDLEFDTWVKQVSNKLVEIREEENKKKKINKA